jgi:hypothetical protein
MRMQAVQQYVEVSSRAERELLARSTTPSWDSVLCGRPYAACAQAMSAVERQAVLERGE